MIEDDIADLMELTTDKMMSYKGFKKIANAILNLPHPELTCTIGEALERMPLMVRRVKAQEKMLVAYRLGSHQIAEKVFDEMAATENVLDFPGGQRIEVKK